MKASQVTIILAQCEVTAAQILLSVPTSVAFSHHSTPSTVSLQLSNRGDKFVNTNYEELKQNVSHFQIYHVTNLRSGTLYFFRIVTFDGCGATYSESVTCHTANRANSITIYSKYKTYILILSSVICVNTFTPQILLIYVDLVLRRIEFQLINNFLRHTFLLNENKISKKEKYVNVMIYCEELFRYER